MEISSDPYEQKLYLMFKSHDTECLGTLDETALIKLCNSLELNDQGNVLLGSLIRGNNLRVSFKAFKEALLNFLGTEMENTTEKNLVITENHYKNGVPDSPGREVSPKLIMGAKKYGRRSRPQSLITDSSHSDSENENSVVPDVNKALKVQRSSSQSEISGTRRRRPSSGTKLKRCASLPAQKGQRVKEQLIKQQTSPAQAQLASSVESLGNLDFENLSHTLYEIWTIYGNELGTHYLNRVQLENVCERVGLQKVAGKVAEEVFEKLKKSACDTITFTDFIGLIQNDADSSAAGSASDTRKYIHVSESLTPLVGNSFTLMDSSNDNDLHAKDIPTLLETVPVRSITEMWESVNIPDAKGLLSNLGFDDEEINVSQLSKTLEEELRGLHGESQISLLRALLALRKAEVASLQQSFRQLIEENHKLYAENKDANRRAALLAQEIDERHANLEDSTKTEIRMLEQRHAEVIRELTSQLANDRENWSALNVRLESRIKALEQDETKLKNELNSLQEENCALEKEQILLQKQLTHLLETNIKLNNEIVDLEDKQRSDDGHKSEKETEEVLELIEKITSLQVENANLRDKNDELVAEVEGLGVELVRHKNKKNTTPREGGAAADTNTESLSDDPEQTTLGVKRRGDSPSKARITEESPRLGKLRKCSNDNSENETSGEWMAINSELNAKNNSSVITPTTTTSGFSQDFSSISDAKDEEIKNLRDKIGNLERELNELKNANPEKSIGAEVENTENENYQTRCQELENSLEQMRKAYEDCEDYWQCKLNEERQLFEKERQIYEDEQQESDKKFSELMEKVREYEEQFSKEGRLSPIEEKDTLEQQYVDLETEVEEIKDNAKKILEEKTKEMAKLQDLVQELKSRLGEKAESSSHATAENTDLESPASSPINYLWNQSTIQMPARDYQNPKWSSKPKLDSDTAAEEGEAEQRIESPPNIQPIQKPKSAGKHQSNNKECDETVSDASAKSFDTHSIASTHTRKSSIVDVSTCSSPNAMKEDLKRLKILEIQMKEHIQDLAHKRDSLVMELQQLQEKAYARAAHPTLLQRVNQLEQKNRHLQTVLRQQQQYTESIMHQTWQQQRSEISELRNRLETQGMIMTEQAQRLANADILVKDLYVENSHLTATIQRLEQQRSRANLLNQHQGLSGVPGMP